MEDKRILGFINEVKNKIPFTVISEKQKKIIDNLFFIFIYFLFFKFKLKNIFYLFLNLFIQVTKLENKIFFK